MSAGKELLIPNYELTKKLNESPQSIIYKGFHKKYPKHELIIKILKTVSLSEHQKIHFRQKVEHLKVLNNPMLNCPPVF